MLIEKIKADMITAKKAGDKNKASLLVTLYSEAVKVGKDKENRDSTDTEVVGVVKKFLNGIDETLQVLGNQGTAVQIFLQERDILNSYLPQQLDREELEDIIGPLHIAGKNMGEIMKHLKENYAGLYDGRIAADIIKRL